jgi:hypothetical protein
VPAGDEPARYPNISMSRQPQPAAQVRRPTAQATKTHDQPGVRPWQWFILAAGVPLAICASRLNLDLWHDEIYTIDYFVAQGPAFIVSDYSLPNNHVLYSLLLWPVYLLSDSNFVLRLPSLACTLGTLALVFRLAQRWAGISAAVIATALLGLNQMFLIHTIQVRGYPLSMLLAIGLASLVLPEANFNAWRRRAMIVLAGAAFLYVLPTNVLFLLPLASVAVAASAGRREGIARIAAEAATWCAAALVAAFAYLPIAGQVLQAGGARGLADSADAGARLARLLSPDWTSSGRLAIDFVSPATRDVWWLGPLLVAGLAAWAVHRPKAISQCGAAPPSPVPAPPSAELEAAPAAQRCPGICLGLVLTTWCGVFLLCGVLHISPFERNFCPLLPLTAVAAGCLLDELLQALGARLSNRWSPAWTAAGGLVLLLAAIGPRLASYASRLDERRREVAGQRWPVQDGYYNYYAADYRPSAVANWLAEHHIERKPYAICLADEDQLDLSYYLRRAGLPRFHGLSTAGDPRPVAVFAAAPAAAPWSRLAGTCGLTESQLRHFKLVGDFGYHQLFRSPRSLPVGVPGK